MTTHEVELRDAWRHLADNGHSQALERLLGRYREPHRRYHTTEHVAHVLRHVAEIAATGVPGDTPSDLPAVLLAALFHDAVYNPAATGRGANEIASGALAGSCASAFGWSDERATAVERLVFATADHEPDGIDAAVLIDADLAILGAEPAAYTAYVQGVREEYHHVADDAWLVGRTAVLQHFLQRERIFTTPYMSARREHHARANLAAELATLVRP